MTITLQNARADALRARRAELLTVKEFSQVVRKNEEYVRQLCRLGRIPGAVRVCGTWMIDLGQVLAGPGQPTI